MSMASVPKSDKEAGGSKGKEEKGKEEKGKGCREEARHAIAKTLVTTNPNLLTEAQRMG